MQLGGGGVYPGDWLWSQPPCVSFRVSLPAEGRLEQQLTQPLAKMFVPHAATPTLQLLAELHSSAKSMASVAPIPKGLSPEEEHDNFFIKVDVLSQTPPAITLE